MRKLLFSFYSVVLVFLLISAVGVAQQVTNVRARQEDKKIIITYDLIEGESGQTFTVKLLVSEDGGFSWKGPLQAVTGDAGLGVSAGCKKQLVWDALSEPGRDKLQGDRIGFKVKASYAEKPKTDASGFGKPCPGMPTFTDPRDSQVYPTVQIGDQCWMQKNMNYQTGNSWCYDNNSSNCNTYGRLYDWETALKVCPNGWHLPSDAEWQKLVDFLGGDAAGGKMREPGTNHWKSPNQGATNSSGFSALPGGYRYTNGDFGNLKFNANFWSATEISSGARDWSLHYSRKTVARNDNNNKSYGFSCQCLRD
jgi:uncharacterized protein (TIGR02145 family)